MKVFCNGEQIVTHLRSFDNHRHTTAREHMHRAIVRFADWLIERICRNP